jgi:hypothetical protein
MPKVASHREVREAWSEAFFETFAARMHRKVVGAFVKMQAESQLDHVRCINRGDARAASL